VPFGNPILAGNTLARTSMQSEDFVAGVSGWAVYRDGSAEFNNVIVRGELLARAANGAYVRVYNDATSGRIDLRPPNSAGGVIVPASIVSSATNPESGNPALLLTGPTVDGFGGASIYLASGDSFIGKEIFLDSDYFWLTATEGCSWVVDGDWEIARNAPGPSFEIYFQVQGSTGACISGYFSGGGQTSGAVTSDPNIFGGTHFVTDGTVDDDSLRVNFNVLTASYLQSRVQSSSATLTLTTYQEISTSSDVQFSKENVDALTSMIVRMSAGCRSTAAATVVQFGVRVKTFAGATIGDVDLFRITMSTANVHTYASGVNKVTGLALSTSVFMKMRPIWKIITASGPTITMDANDTLCMEIEEKTN
jgi:hypothetical protein